MNSEEIQLRDIVNFNIKCLHIFGYFSPDKGSSVRKIMYQIYAVPFFILTFILCISSQLANMIAVFGDIEKMTEASFLLLTNCNQIFKIYVFSFNGPEVWNFIKSMDRKEFKPQNKEEHEILSQEIRTSKLISKVFLFMCFMTCCLWGIFPFLDRKPGENIRLPLSGWYPFKTNKSPEFQLVYFYQIFATLINGMGNISMDTFLSGTIMLISGQLNVLNNAIQRLSTYDNTYKKKEEVQINFKLIRNVIHYRNIIQFSEEMTNLFTVCFMSQFLISVIIICLTMFQMSLVSVVSLQFFSMLLYQSCILLEIFLWCYYGNEVILQSEKLTISTYMCNWISQSKEFRKNLLFFMTRTQVPLKLYAGGYFTLSLSTYMAILKSSWSYFAVLNSIHSEQM